MKLSITHLAPYLPYGLKWKFDGEDLTHDVVGLDITIMLAIADSIEKDAISLKGEAEKELQAELDKLKELDDNTDIPEINTSIK